MHTLRLQRQRLQGPSLLQHRLMPSLVVGARNLLKRSLKLADALEQAIVLLLQGDALLHLSPEPPEPGNALGLLLVKPEPTPCGFGQAGPCLLQLLDPLLVEVSIGPHL